MLARRNRALIKPNIAKATKLGRTPSEKTTPASKNQPEPVDATSIVESVECSDHPPVVETTSNAVANETPSETIASIQESSPSIIIDEPSGSVNGDSVCEEHYDPLAPERRIAHVPVDRSKLHSPRSGDRSYYTDYYERNLPKPRKKFSGDEELDPKKMRMMDMIYWNPKNQKSMTKRHIETESVVSEGRQPTIEKLASTSTNKPAAPQVKLGPDGRLVIDESSLVITETVNDESVWETIDEDRVSRKITSLSFRNRLWRKGTSWTEKETELFYEILRCTGPDFGLMHEFFPTRARNELKTKFNREERSNWAKLKEVMGKPALLDDDLYERAAILQKEIEEEALNKKLKKMKDLNEAVERKYKPRKKKKKGAEEEWDEDTADLVEEAATLIRELEREQRVSGDNEEEDDGESNSVEEPPVEIRRSERTKKLSIKAQELLDQTMKTMELSKMQLTEDGAKAPEDTYDGYDEGSDSDTETDSSDDEDFAGPSTMYYRKRKAPRVTFTTSILPRRGMKSSQAAVTESPQSAARETGQSAATESCPAAATVSDQAAATESDQDRATVSGNLPPSHDVMGREDESRVEAPESDTVLDNVQPINQPCSSKDSAAPASNGVEQNDRTIDHEEAGDAGGEPQPDEPSPTENNVTPTGPSEPSRVGNLKRVKHSKASIASRTAKPQGSGSRPLRKRIGEKAKPNIKLKNSKNSKTASHNEEASAPSSTSVPEVPVEDGTEERDTVANEPNSEVRSPEPQATS
nr:Hypothetical protein CBG12854 [Haemonchus contortus]